MLRAHLRRGLAAGLLAGLLAGLVGLAVGEPPVDAAIAIEEASATADEPDDAAAFTRGQQKAGLVAGTALVGLGVGVVFGIATGAAAGRIKGDAWQRALKLGAALVAGWVLLPFVKYAPNPPAVGDPDTVATRSALYVGLGVLGLLLAAAAATSAAALRRRTAWPAAVRQATVGGGVVLVAAALLAVLPDVGGAGTFPADVLWRFRLGSLATQVTLYGGVAVIAGLLGSRAERHAAAPQPA